MIFETKVLTLVYFQSDLSKKIMKTRCTHAHWLQLRVDLTSFLQHRQIVHEFLLLDFFRFFDLSKNPGPGWRKFFESSKSISILFSINMNFDERKLLSSNNFLVKNTKNGNKNRKVFQKFWVFVIFLTKLIFIHMPYFCRTNTHQKQLMQLLVCFVLVGCYPSLLN